MLVKNNGYWRRLCKLGKRAARHNVHLVCPVKFDFNKVKTLEVRFFRAKLNKKKHKAKYRNRLHCCIQPGRY